MITAWAHYDHVIKSEGAHILVGIVAIIIENETLQGSKEKGCQFMEKYRRKHDVSGWEMSTLTR